MDRKLYRMIFKRKSFHFYKDMGKLSREELDTIYSYYASIEPLYACIRTRLSIVPVSETTMKRGEYALLLFSEKKRGYLENIGYLGAQLDLFLASLNIGVCWYGAGKLKQNISTDLEFVIMLSAAKVSESSFRKDMFKSRRKASSEIWHGCRFSAIADIVRFAPSACNGQPWLVEDEGAHINVFLCMSSSRKGIMPKDKKEYYEHIDMGIFLCFLELCLSESNILYSRVLYQYSSSERVLIAKYIICRKEEK